MSLQALKKGTPPDQILIPKFRFDDEADFNRIRCPLCEWEPTPLSRWSCESAGTPEPFFGGCRTIWHTFETGGLCPGCQHQWQWTSCLRCGGWSPHDDWYA